MTVPLFPRSLALVLAALAAIPLARPAEAQVVSPGSVTNFASLEALAKQMAAKPYSEPASNLDPFFQSLKYDGHRKIRFNPEKALFAAGSKEPNTCTAEFFHPGWLFKKPVRIFDLDGQASHPVPCSADFFDYGDLKPPPDVKAPEGFAGFRLLAPHSLLRRPFEFISFLGASYYRAATTELGYGTSARGIAVNTIGADKEEFPDFTHFWLVRPKEGDGCFRILALLSGPSITGAYQIDAKPGKTTETFVKGTVFLRHAVKSLGVAPFSSMFWYGENSHPKPEDFRPEVHDSDGLQIELEGGHSSWRPLDVGKDLRASFFKADHLKGFGLAERDRDFANFQDLEAMYHRRAAVWVRPIRGFEKGSVVLVEIPTPDETNDNIAAYFQPERIPSSPSEPLSFEYQLSWLEERLPDVRLARVIATRRGFAMQSDDHLYVIDFAKGAAQSPPAKDWKPKLEVAVSAGEAKVLHQDVIPNTQTGGWRVFFRLDVPPETRLLELACELFDERKQTISERWQYQWRR